MSGLRLDRGGQVDRSRRLSFTFDGRSYLGFEGDTLASALLACGVRIFGRSFKYHRPRGVWGAWIDDPNAIMTVRLGDIEIPNVAATTTPLVEGMQARSVNAWPSARFDVKGGLDLFHRFLPAGFYYKTFMWPDWHLFEPTIRKLAGLGAVDSQVIDGHTADQVNDDCDLLVVGGGAPGLAAARAAAEAGQSVLLAEDHPLMGGGLFAMGVAVEGNAPQEWISNQLHAFEAAGGRALTSTTAFGVFDHGLVGLVEDRGFGAGPRLWRVRAKRIVLASGALDRPLTFANNDLPGIMSVEAALEYLGRYGVLVGRDIVLASNNSMADLAENRLTKAGATVTRVDPLAGAIEAKGWRTFSSLAQSDRGFGGDVLLCSAGLSPLLHLWRHAGGKLRWSDDHAAFLPDHPPEAMQAVGAANGTFELEPALDEARQAGLGIANAVKSTYAVRPHLPKPGSKGRQWIDFQNDVTLKDVELAARENLVSVEHLKRYTTLGMATDQGKTSNVAGLAAMAAIQGKTIPEVGTTTFRPPFVPVPFEMYRGHHRGQLFHPLKRLALESRHRNADAALGEYGGWLRPGWYGTKPAPEAIKEEALMARRSVGVFDGSPLGKVEVMGPDAAAFLDYVFYNTISTLNVGRIRYAFMLTESGVIFDDGVVARVGPDHFVISCSSSHVDGVARHLEATRQDGPDPDRIFIHDATFQWSTVTIAGPKARHALAALAAKLDLSNDALPHMTFQDVAWRDTMLRVARVSFTGELSFEISVPSSRAQDLWDAAISSAKEFGGGPIGIEASSILRAEKGFIIVGKDTDGETMPHDIGFGAPRLRKKAAFVGDRSLHRDVAEDADRKVLIGLSVSSRDPALATGAHIITSPDAPVSLGFVTSSYDSPNLGRPIALALMRNGAKAMGGTILVQHLGEVREAKVVAPCAFDPAGERLNA